jgi:hypothetical protein
MLLEESHLEIFFLLFGQIASLLVKSAISGQYQRIPTVAPWTRMDSK